MNYIFCKCGHTRAFLSMLLAILSWLMPMYGLAEQEQSVKQTLDMIDSKDFLEIRTSDADSPILVAHIASNVAEVKYLVAHTEEAIPEMIRRLNAPGAIKYEEARTVYFIIFGEVKDPRTLPALADYIDSVPDSDVARLEAGNGVRDPLLYAIDAARSLGIEPEPLPVSSHSQMPSAAQVVAAKHALASRIRAESHTPDPEVVSILPFLPNQAMGQLGPYFRYVWRGASPDILYSNKAPGLPRKGNPAIIFHGTDGTFST